MTGSPGHADGPGSKRPATGRAPSGDAPDAGGERTSPGSREGASSAPERGVSSPGGQGASGQGAAVGEPAAAVAERVREVLTAAEQAAAAMRREAEADAARVRSEKERRRAAELASQVRHLARLADAMSVNAETVKRQCELLDALLVDPEAALEEPLGPAAAGRRAGAPDPFDADERRVRERIDAYRMKLAGAGRDEVERYLERRDVDDPTRVAREVFPEETSE